MSTDDFAERIRRIRTTIRERARQGGVDSLFSEIVSLIENHCHEPREPKARLLRKQPEHSDNCKCWDCTVGGPK